jgi:twinkle protein
VAGEPGKSLKIVLTGEKVGVWSDFEGSVSGGDLLDLWMAIRNLTLYEAMLEAADHARVTLDGRESRPKRSYTRPERPRNARKPQGRVMAYLQARGLSETTLDDFQIGELEDQWILFPYKRTRDGELINTKYLHVDRENGKKQMRQEKEAEPCLFGWNALRTRYPDTRYVALTEGEIDCASLHQCGIPSLSVPNGGGGGRKQDWIENDYDYLEQFDTIYLCLDNDPAGKEAEKEIIKRLGTERCRVVTLPYKDANECLMKGIINFSDYFYKAKSFDPEELKSAFLFTDSVLDKFYPTPNTYHGMKSPWENFNKAMTFQREELIVWSGFSGSGKSTLLNHVVAQGLLQNEKFAICSMEMPSKTTLYRMVRQFTGEKCPTSDRIYNTMHWLNDKLWMVDVIGVMKVERLLEVIKYAAKRYNIKNFIIDSLTKCGIREDDYDGQKAFVDALTDFCHQYEGTVHLVVHQRKPITSKERPDKFGARGAAAITDEANSVICVYRNSADGDQDQFKRRKIVETTPHLDQPDTIISIEKNRETGIEGKFDLYFDADSLQFHEVRQASIDYTLQIESAKIISSIIQEEF